MSGMFTTMRIEETLARHCLTLADDTFLLNSAARSFMRERLLPAMLRHDRTSAALHIPDSVYVVFSDASSGQSDCADAEDALRVLDEFRHAGRLEAIPLPCANGDMREVFVGLLYRYHLKHDVAILTNREEVASAVLGAARSRAMQKAIAPRVLRPRSDSSSLDEWNVVGTQDGETHAAPTQPAHSMRHVDIGNLAHDTRIFIDTCSLMVEGAEEFIRHGIAPALAEGSSKVVIDQSVVAELYRHINRVTDGRSGKHRAKLEETKARARSGLDLVDEMVEAGIAEIRKEDDGIQGGDDFFDAVAHQIFLHPIQGVRLALITQDTELARQLIANAESMGMLPMPVICYIDRHQRSESSAGGMGNWAWRLRRTSKEGRGSSASRHSGAPAMKIVQEQVLSVQIDPITAGTPTLCAPRYPDAQWMPVITYVPGIDLAERPAPPVSERKQGHKIAPVQSPLKLWRMAIAKILRLSR